MRVNLVDTPRDQLWSSVSGRNIIPDREGIGMGKPTVEVEEEGEAAEEVVVVVVEAEVIDRSEDNGVGSNTVALIICMV